MSNTYLMGNIKKDMEYVQLTWINWNKVCNFVSENFIEGTYLTENNIPISDYGANPFPINLDKLGLYLLINGEKKLAITNDYIIKEKGEIKIISEKKFERKIKLEKLKKIK